MKIRAFALCLAMLLCAAAAHAHVGSPDVYAEGQAGPYKLSIVIRPPLVIPGIADIDVRTETSGVDRIMVTPVPLTGEASLHPPAPDAMQRPTNDAQFFTGHLWIMATGSWQIRFAVNGGQGSGTLSIPVPATALGTRPMTSGMGIMLACLGALLVLGMVGIVGAAAREAKLPPGAAVPQANRRSAYIAMTVTFAVLVAGIILGNAWWKSEAAGYSGNIYKPLQMDTALVNGSLLELKLRDPGWLPQRKLDDLIPDHDHLMHLYVIRWPDMDVVAHLHPQLTGAGEFQLALPSLPAGTYHLYADVVHASGFPETLVSTMTLPAITGRPLAGDDAEGAAAPLSQSAAVDTPKEQRFKLPDGYTMVWTNAGEVAPRAPVYFQFALLDPQGHPPQDMTLYMGMIGHAAFVKTDGATFAHIHPTGSVSMAAFMMANPQAQMKDTGMDMQNMPGMNMKPDANMKMDSSAIPNIVGFPYGFPSEGTYRIFVQMKHGNTIETGIFDAKAGNPTA
jgi:hypothetical protein